MEMKWGDENSGVKVEAWMPESVALEGERLAGGEAWFAIQRAMTAAMRDLVREIFPWGMGEQIEVAMSVEEK